MKKKRTMAREEEGLDWNNVFTSIPHITWKEFERKAVKLAYSRDIVGLRKLQEAFIHCLSVHQKIEKKRREELTGFIQKRDLDCLSREELTEKIKRAVELNESPSFMSTEEKRIESERLWVEFHKEFKKTKSLKEAEEIAGKYDTIDREKKLDPTGSHTRFLGSVYEHADEMFPYEKGEYAPPVRKPPIALEREKEDEQDTQEDRVEITLIPKKHLATRFFDKDKPVPLGRNEVVRFENERVEIPDTFPFSYAMEMVLLGFFNLLTKSGFSSTLLDRGRGYFPGSIGKKIFSIPIRRQSELFEAIGMVERKPGSFYNEEAVKMAFGDLLAYKHPVIHKRDTGVTTEDGKKIIDVIINHEPLFCLYKYDRIVDEDRLRSTAWERNPNGGWKTKGNLKNSIVMLNPTFWPKGIESSYRSLDSSLYRKIEESRRRLSGADGKRYWRKEPCFFVLAYYLLKQGGKYKESRLDGRIYYEIERELWGLLKKIGLWERYKHDKSNALTALERALRIYLDMDYLLIYEWLEANRKSKKKLRMVYNLEKFPHLQQPSYRFVSRH